MQNLDEGTAILEASEENALNRGEIILLELDHFPKHNFLHDVRRCKSRAAFVFPSENIKN
jgi:hypothetical protein